MLYERDKEKIYQCMNEIDYKLSEIKSLLNDISVCMEGKYDYEAEERRKKLAEKYNGKK